MKWDGTCGTCCLRDTCMSKCKVRHRREDMAYTDTKCPYPDRREAELREQLGETREEDEG